MTQAEIGLAIADRVQPRYDVEPVPEAGLDDLDSAALARTLARVRDALVAETVSALRRHMSVRSYVNGTGRREQFDYPPEAVREAVVNAVLHRDYSQTDRASVDQSSETSRAASRCSSADQPWLAGAIRPAPRKTSSP